MLNLELSHAWLAVLPSVVQGVPGVTEFHSHLLLGPPNLVKERRFPDEEPDARADPGRVPLGLHHDHQFFLALVLSLWAVGLLGK